MPKLTKRTVDAAIKTATSEARQVTITDTITPGLYLRVEPSGRAHWYYRYRVGGKRVRIPLGRHGGAVKSVEDARAAAQDHAQVVQRGDDPRAVRKASVEAPTMVDLGAEYLERHAKPHKASWEKDEQRLRDYVVPALGPVRVRDVTREQVRTLLTDVGAKRGKPGTANKVRALLSKMFALAIEWGYRPDNPCAGLGKSVKKGGAAYPVADVHRYLQPAEVRALVAALDTAVGDPVAAAAIRWILMTGCRHSEALGLRWSDVDTERMRVHMATKTGDQWRAVSPQALAILDRLERPEVGDAFVFGSPRGAAKERASLYYWWGKALAAAEIGDCRIHDLRHSAASMAAANGASLSQIGAMLGHKSAQATYMYQHLVDDDVRNVATGVAASIEAAIAAPAKVKRLRRRR